jgi:hypothetical protein
MGWPQNHSSLEERKGFHGGKHTMAPLFRLFAIFAGLCPEDASEVEFLCLAYSRKRGGRCLAGIQMNNGGWIRPVGDDLDRAISKKIQAKIGDVLSVSLGNVCPKPHQPENRRLHRLWYKPWHKLCRRVGRLKQEEFLDRLKAYVYEEQWLLGDYQDRIGEEQFLNTPAEASLALIEPEHLQWLIQTSRSGRRQTRAIFSWKGANYNLVVTDPEWELQLKDLTVGCHEHMALNMAGQKAFLTISLSEPFNGFCYKLVAAVIVL